MAIKITVTPKDLRGKRLYLLFMTDGDIDQCVDVVIAEQMPEACGDEWYKSVNELELAGIFNGRGVAKLEFDDDGRLVSIA